MSYGKKRISGINNGKFYLSVLLITLLLSLYITECVYIISLEKKMIETRREKDKLVSENTNLKIQAAVLRKGGRIKTIASENLGLIIPEGAPEKLF